MLKSNQPSRGVASAFSKMGKKSEERRAEEERQRVIQEMIEGKKAEIAILSTKLEAEKAIADDILKELVQSENKITSISEQIQAVQVEIDNISN